MPMPVRGSAPQLYASDDLKPPLCEPRLSKRHAVKVATHAGAVVLPRTALPERKSDGNSGSHYFAGAVHFMGGVKRNILEFEKYQVFSLGRRFQKPYI